MTHDPTNSPPTIQTFHSARMAGRTVVRSLISILLGAPAIAFATMDMTNPMSLYIRQYSSFILLGIPLAVWGWAISREINAPVRNHAPGRMLLWTMILTGLNGVFLIVNSLFDFRSLFAYFGLLVQILAFAELVIYSSFLAVDKKWPPLNIMIALAVMLAILVFQYIWLT